MKTTSAQLPLQTLSRAHQIVKIFAPCQRVRTTQTHTNTPAMEDSPLGKLPAELRNRIYTFVFQRPSPIKILLRPPRKRSLTTDDETKEDKPTSLLLTCRQVNVECSQLFYAVNTFEIDNYDPNSLAKFPIKFFTQIGVGNCSAVQMVRVCHGTNVSADTSGETARSYLIGGLTKLRRSMLFFSLPALVVHFRCSGAKDAFSRQGLPPNLVCDLGDLGEPWEEQIRARHSQRDVETDGYELR